MLHTHLSSGASTIGQLVADVRNELSHLTPRKLKEKNCQEVHENKSVETIEPFIYTLHFGTWLKYEAKFDSHSTLRKNAFDIKMFRKKREVSITWSSFAC
jgi:hypothetical protein